MTDLQLPPKANQHVQLFSPLRTCLVEYSALLSHRYGVAPETSKGQSFLEAYSLCVTRLSVVSPDLFRPLKGKELWGLITPSTGRLSEGDWEFQT